MGRKIKWRKLHIFSAREWAELGYTVIPGMEPVTHDHSGCYSKYLYHWGQVRPQQPRYLKQKYPRMFGIEKDTRITAPGYAGFGYTQEGAMSLIDRIIEEYEKNIAHAFEGERL